MAIAQAGKSITFTAVNESILWPGDVREIVGMTFQGTGLTATHRLKVTDAKGTILADYLVEAATDNADLWAGRPPQIADGGIVITNNAVGGTWVLTVLLKA